MKVLENWRYSDYRVIWEKDNFMVLRINLSSYSEGYIIVKWIQDFNSWILVFDNVFSNEEEAIEKVRTILEGA